MKPEIEDYLRKHGGKYTTKALRKQLLFAGHDAAEVDAALAETEATRAPQFEETRQLRRRFWLVAIGLHLIALVAATAWWALWINSAYAGFVPFILGFFLIIGLLISGLIGRGLLGRGVAVALVVPLISAALLGGTCMAMAGPRVGI
jgi:hypothetical protein